ncbi:hypothetical protein DFH27DRAFT_582903 [Peziza echinospora]|nr:hypothetical protein DFH27DRAFT_582903 [Peziza echinospora]
MSGSTFAQRIAQRRATPGGNPTGTGAGSRKLRRGRDLSETGGKSFSDPRKATGLPPPPELKSYQFNPTPLTLEALYQEIPAVITTPLGKAKAVQAALPASRGSTPSRRWGPQQWEQLDAKMAGVAKKVVEGRRHDGGDSELREGGKRGRRSLDLVVRGTLDEAKRYIGKNKSYGVADKRKIMTPLWAVLAPPPAPPAQSAQA